MSHALLEEFRRYAALIESAVADVAEFSPSAESATAVQVERGLVYARLLRQPAAPSADLVDRLIELTRSERFRRMAVVDRTGHHRPIYRPLLIYAWLQAFRLAYEELPRADFGRWEEGSRAWCDLLEAELADVAWDDNAALAARGATVAEAAWMALALHLAGKVFIRDAWTDLAAELFGKLVRAQQPDGAFLLAGPSDNPESRWYHELVILHAAAGYAVQAEDRTVATAVLKSTQFHMAGTQPDHATTHPFALFAFIWNPATRPLADGILHGVHTLHPGGADSISAVLLADALHCLRLFL